MHIQSYQHLAFRVQWVECSLLWRDIPSPSLSHQSFLEAGRWSCYGKKSCTTPDPQTPATALLLRSRTTVFPFLKFQTRFIKLLDCTDADYTSFFISISSFISVYFSWDLLVASRFLNTSHFADALVNLFYFSSESLLKVLGIMSK